jgi:type I restriction enzyme S subunit
VSSSGISDFHSEAKAIGPGVVTGRYGTIGNVYYIESDFWPLNTTLYVSNFKGNDPRFVAYFLRGIDFLAYSDKAAVPGLNRNHLHTAQVRYPRDRKEQVALASVLAALDDKIEVNRRMNETLEAMARAVFRDWFVDFGPTRTKMLMRGEDPQKEGVAPAPYLAPDLWSLFPDKLDPATGLPEGWEMGTLDDIAETVGSNVSPQTVSSDTPYIGLEHMPRQSLALDTWEGAGKVASGKSSFVQGDILFGKLRPYFHKVGLAPIDGICSTDIVVLNSQRPHFHAFLAVAVSSDEFVAFTDRTSDGTKMPRTSWGKMSAFPLCIPKGDAASAFDGVVSSLFRRMQQNIRETRNLAETRDYLLPKLMSGEIRVRDAERIAGEAA